MNHPFVLSWHDVNHCAKCKLDKIAHTEHAICEICSNETSCDLFPAPDHPKAILMCPICIQKELDAARKASEEDIKTVGEIRVQAMNSVIECRAQFFNAHTSAIMQQKEEFYNSNPELSDEVKRYKFSELLNEQIQNYKRAFFEVNETALKISNEMRATITYLADFADQLTNEQRERLQIANINFNPVPIKVKDVKLPLVKLSKEEQTIRNYATLMKISVEDARKRILGK